MGLPPPPRLLPQEEEEDEEEGEEGRGGELDIRAQQPLSSALVFMSVFLTTRLPFLIWFHKTTSHTR